MNQKELFPGLMKSFQWKDDVLECISENLTKLRIEVLQPELLRVRYATQGYFQKDFSYALDDGFLKKSGTIEFSDYEDYLEIRTEAVKCRVQKVDLKVTFLNLQDQVINKDEKGFHWEVDQETGNDIVQLSKVAYPSEVYYGLGDKPSELNLKGKRFQNWGTDCYGYDYGWDPLYKNIPFYYGLHGNKGYGIFFDNSFRTFFDFGKERNSATSFWAHGGEMNYYFIAGPELLDVTSRYAELTGKPDMPALWTLGFQQCKWSYYPESEVREVTQKMRDLRIPCDAIYLDIDYMDGFRCFTWDKEKFPDPKKMIDDLREDGFKTMVIIDPGIKIDHEYDVFKEGIENDYFCKRLDGPYVEGKVWPGDCYFPDFTKPEVRTWWAGLYKGLIEDMGVAGVWNDMNEPALFEVESKTMPDDVMFDYEGNPASHRKAHNVYGMQMARATYEGVKKYSNNKRGLIITRSGYSGMQRYSSVWTGDNIATWQHVWLANIQCQRLAISGVSFAGSDIGGFIGQPTPDMFVRWIQLAIFHPFCRVHSSQDDGDQEPWSFGEEATNLFREAIELRYQMLPYHYTAFNNHIRTGRPIIKPLSFVDQNNPDTYNRDHEFVCGDNILSSSITEERATVKDVYLPKGEWYNYWSDTKHSGASLVKCSLKRNTFPFYVRAGAVVPFYPVQQYVGEKEFDSITLHVYANNGVQFSELYEDDHDGYQHEEGIYRLSTFKVTGASRQLTIAQDIVGDFVPKYSSYNVVLHGVNGENLTMSVDGQEVNDGIASIDFSEVIIKW